MFQEQNRGRMANESTFVAVVNGSVIDDADEEDVDAFGRTMIRILTTVLVPLIFGIIVVVGKYVR